MEPPVQPVVLPAHAQRLPVGRGVQQHTPRPVDIDIDSRIGEITVARADGSVAQFRDFLRETYTDAFVVVTRRRWSTALLTTGMTPIHPR